MRPRSSENCMATCWWEFQGTAQRNFMTRWFREITPIMSTDDDISRVERMIPGPTKKTEPFRPGGFCPGRIYPVANSWFMQGKTTALT
jgi:hypothetical protein